MPSPRLDRNVERSIKDYIISKLSSAGYTGINVVLGFNNAYNTNTSPTITINAVDIPVEDVEIGSKSIFNDIIVDINIFTKGAGLRLDLARYLTEELNKGMTYNTYTLTSNGNQSEIDETTPSGRITVRNFIQSRQAVPNLEGLQDIDKERHIITINCRVVIS